MKLAGAEGEVAVCGRAIRRQSLKDGHVRGETDPKGSPTTQNATSSLSALARMLSLSLSTISRSATMTGQP